MNRTPVGKMHNLVGLIGWLAITFAFAAVGAQFKPGAWYDGLAKAAWNPPAWIFAPVWTLLYLLMAVAAWRVWRQAGWTRARLGLGVYVVQLILNALWSFLFFGLHRPDLALADLVMLWIAIFAAWQSFRRIDRPAGWLFVPYLAWVTFAATLNYAVWKLNGGA